ncbi:glycosyltransferase [Shewanella surugensis]|uniref:Glycosyltransferase n=1 Tax=Shewanella surugensis TaxID=212020 RepID=A0ABT0LI95_9GAMM|nr:glycosyltransferase [Shewanella surugensis]MCL1126846.1 glycosyltransferase [Shewanella surugensis]
MNISFIIPYSKRPFERDNSRLISLINAIDYIPKTNIIVFDSTNNKAKNIPKKDNITYIHSPLNNNIYSPAYARNQAVKFSKSDYLFFIDVDLLVPRELLKRLISIANKLIKINITAFEMFPCLYLTEAASKKSIKTINKDIQLSYLTSYMIGHNDIIESIALATSCLLVNRKWFIELRGFDESFLGHGGEDLEFICRLALHTQKGSVPLDFSHDKKSTHPANYKGFRRYLAQYSLTHLFEYDFFVHLWHPRPLTHKYHRQRKVNEQLLHQKLDKLMTKTPSKITDTNSKMTSADILDTQYQHWINVLQQHYQWPFPTYSGLFYWKKNIIVKRYFWRKCRKLYVKPKLFFADFIKKHMHFPPTN